MVMDCKEAEKLVPAFLQDDLDSKTLEQFIKHLEGCPDCTEELTIQFLVSEGLEQLEAGNNFNLQHALYEKLGNAKYETKVHKGLQYTLFGLEAAVAVAILAAIMIFLS